MSGIAQHGRATAQLYNQGTLPLHSYFKPKAKKRYSQEDEEDKQSTQSEEGTKRPGQGH